MGCGSSTEDPKTPSVKMSKSGSVLSLATSLTDAETDASLGNITRIHSTDERTIRGKSIDLTRSATSEPTLPMTVKDRLARMNRTSPTLSVSSGKPPKSPVSSRSVSPEPERPAAPEVSVRPRVSQVRPSPESSDVSVDVYVRPPTPVTTSRSIPSSSRSPRSPPPVTPKKRSRLRRNAVDGLVLSKLTKEKKDTVESRKEVMSTFYFSKRLGRFMTQTELEAYQNASTITDEVVYHGPLNGRRP